MFFYLTPIALKELKQRIESFFLLIQSKPGTRPAYGSI